MGKEKLSVMDVEKGLDPLHAFLGEDVPHQSCPRINDSESPRNNVENWKDKDEGHWDECCDDGPGQ